ncbi:RING finger domain-containing protein [Endozoicomonas sp. 8E]|uniref:RING finger domain-containing protein n=1 Tax=Endozoicomonas sp. 8E TaxID=3035692 RepID=UPI002938F6A6|nr:RING finger domain-containing protein [Endozoicomonas sp. 8E]WOG29493.1 RING finger domain-containing protein [Endozoicomonas sp. 8E]
MKINIIRHFLILLIIFFIPNEVSAQSICPICLEILHDEDKSMSLCCQHEFHDYCILRWNKREKKETCPVCRKELIYHHDLHILKSHDLCRKVPYIKIEITPHLCSFSELYSVRSRVDEVLSVILKQEIDMRLEEEIERLRLKIINLHLVDDDDDDDDL